MKIVSVTSLPIPEVKVIRYQRFADRRGYFTETYRKSDFERHPELGFIRGVDFTQCNESHSKAGTVRGLHFQWNPYMGKLVRTTAGRMVDLALDIRKGSPTFGKIVAYDLTYESSAPYGEWIWVPAGFAHGNYYTAESRIEYFCSGEWSPDCEAGISPLALDIDWSLCDPNLKREFEAVIAGGPLLTDKDKNGFALDGWLADPRSDNFIHGRI
ncbi:MAG: dTDP-4-dehydrorhamnose 3,5-epimerase family protein [Candidatus Edwardsbacteria bacterium]|nr:dTDP-4-dehydrorhamnose 3,5-epimerase family protein [Candidatus Edwardsbacteria bacterium]